jgi:hypothetical protein
MLMAQSGLDLFISASNTDNSLEMALMSADWGK